METETEPAVESRELQGTAGNCRELQGIAGNEMEIVKLLGKRPELRKELVQFVKGEFGFNVEGILEEYFGELPDKRNKIEDIDMPLREIAENVLQMRQDGYSPSQTASFLGIYPSQVSRILKDGTKWDQEIKKIAQGKIKKSLPWYLRFVSRFVPV